MQSPTASEPGACSGRVDARWEAAEITHRIQNRLAAVRASVQLAVLRCACGASDRYLHQALEGLDEIAAWVGSLVDGTVSAALETTEPVHLGELAMDAVAEVRHLLERSGVHLEFAGDPESSLWARGHHELLKAAIASILTNAAEATPQGGTIRVRAWTEGEPGDPGARAYLAVEDSGPGLPEEVLAGLFKVPISTKGRQGRGVGLLLAYRTVTHLHRGSLSAANLPGGGACITMALPLAQPPGQAGFARAG